MSRGLRRLGPASAEEHAATHPWATRKPVDLADGHRPWRCGGFERMHELVNAAHELAYLVDPWGRHLGKAEGCFENGAGQPHSADRGAEQIRIFRQGAGQDTTITDTDLERGDVIAERSIAVVVLAVDIGRYHSTN